MKKKVVIIGGNAAGMSAASQVKRLKPEWEAVVLEKSDYFSYASCGMPYYLEGIVPGEPRGRFAWLKVIAFWSGSGATGTFRLAQSDRLLVANQLVANHR